MSEDTPPIAPANTSGRELDVSLLPRADVIVLEQAVRQAFTRCHGVEAQLTRDTFRNTVDVLTLIDLLSAQGVIDPGAFDDKRDELEQVMAKEHARAWRGPTLAPDHASPGGEIPEVLVDCERRHPTCHSACCVIYRVHLTAPEVRAGQLLWDLTDPYRLVRKQFGRCAYLDEERQQCTIWENRPQVCRGYSCATDTNIWKDFDAMELNSPVAAFFARVEAAEDGTP